MSTYDARFHITARELRDAGYIFDANVPDAAWVPRGTVQFERGDTPHSPLRTVFLVPFSDLDVETTTDRQPP